MLLRIMASTMSRSPAIRLIMSNGGLNAGMTVLCSRTASGIRKSKSVEILFTWEIICVASRAYQNIPPYSPGACPCHHQDFSNREGKAMRTQGAYDEQVDWLLGPVVKKTTILSDTLKYSRSIPA